MLCKGGARHSTANIFQVENLRVSRINEAKNRKVEFFEDKELFFNKVFYAFLFKAGQERAFANGQLGFNCLTNTDKDVEPMVL